MGLMTRDLGHSDVNCGLSKHHWSEWLVGKRSFPMQAVLKVPSMRKARTVIRTDLAIAKLRGPKFCKCTPESSAKAHPCKLHSAFS